MLIVLLDLESWYGPFCTLTMKQMLEGVCVIFKSRKLKILVTPLNLMTFYKTM